MDREEALKLVKSRLTNKNLVKHSLAVEACMNELAKHFGEEGEKWGLAGLLHDLDYEETVDDFARHGFVTTEILEPLGVDPEILYAIKAHPQHVPAKSHMDTCLVAVDPATGLIIASALMHPSKNLTQVDMKFLLKRFKEKRFAAGANREQILFCQNVDLDKEQFLQICLEAMQKIADQLGL